MRALIAALIARGSNYAALRVKGKAKRISILAAAAAAFFIAFVFALVALYQGLATEVAPWAAALILSAIMIAAGLLCLVLHNVSEKRAERRKAVRAAAISAETMAATALAANSLKLFAPAAALAIGIMLMQGGDKDE